jgi:hypothetical protein
MRRGWRAQARWAPAGLLSARLGLGSARSGPPGLGRADSATAGQVGSEDDFGSLDIEAGAASSEAAAPLGDFASLPRVSSSGSPQSPSPASRFLLANLQSPPPRRRFRPATTPHRREPYSSPQCAISASPPTHSRGALAPRARCRHGRSGPPDAQPPCPSAASLNAAGAPSKTSREAESGRPARDGRAAVTSHPPAPSTAPPTGRRAQGPRGARWLNASDHPPVSHRSWS